MKIQFNTLREKLKEDYKEKGTITSILNGRRKPNADLRYKYEKELGIPFDGWGDKLKNYIEEACPCCGTILRKKK